MSTTDTMNKKAIEDFQRELEGTIHGPLIPIPAKPQNLLTAIERAATNPDVDVTKLRELIQIAREERAYNAEIEFNDSMVRAQSEIGRIAQDKENTQTRSWYATYATLDRAVRPAYVREGFSLSFNTGDAPEGHVCVLCYVSHKGGHTRTYRAVVPSDGKGAKGSDVMTKTHAFGSGMQYGRRYLLKAIFNIAEGVDPEDDDGNGSIETEEQRTKREAAEAKEKKWIDKIGSAQTVSDYEGLRVDLIAEYGGSSSLVPKPLRDFCVEKKAALAATGK